MGGIVPQKGQAPVELTRGLAGCRRGNVWL